MDTDAARTNHPHAGDPVTPVPRWGSILIGLGGTAVLLAVYATRARPPADFSAGDPVRVTPVAVAGGDQGLAAALTAAAVIGLRQSRHLNVVPPITDAVDAPSGAPSEAGDAALETRARYTLRLEVDSGNAGLRITAYLQRGAGTEPTAVVEQVAPDRSELLPALDRTLDLVRLALGERRTERAAHHRPSAEAGSASWSALSAYARGAAHWRAGRSDSAETAWNQAVSADSGFALALAALGAAQLRSGDAPTGHRLLAAAVARASRLTGPDRQRVEAAIRRFGSVPRPR